ncbi:MAG TPA: hypothetical protein PLI52_00195 [Prochlorococcaceae cyanobacterium AMR_MDS_5431]|nr:hypothetical protein [Prochlorococcaceae cyanobacterium AMR_MDS_5431]
MVIIPICNCTMSPSKRLVDKSMTESVSHERQPIRPIVKLREIKVLFESAAAEEVKASC